MKFRRWIEALEVDVIQDEFGYEPGEFTVFPDDWRPLFKEGLTPRAAWQRALDAFAEGRRQRDAEREANWKRIQAADASIREAT